MGVFADISLAELLELSRGGDTNAEERLGFWLLQNVEQKVFAALGRKKLPFTASSLTSNVLVKLVRSQTLRNAPNQGYLHAAIAQATREILIDEFRRRDRRRKGFGQGVPADTPFLQRFANDMWNIVELYDALEQMHQVDSRKATVVTYRYICGMTVAETAAELGVSESTVEADWRWARLWLFERFKSD